MVVSCLSSNVALGRSSEKADSEGVFNEPSAAMLEFIAMFDVQVSGSSEEWIDPLIISDAVDASDAVLEEFENDELVNRDR